MVEKTQTEEVLLTEQDVWDVISFARNYAGYGGPLMSPDMINQSLKDLNLNPMAATETTLLKAMADPKSHEKQLREMSQSFELTSMVYKRLISYLTNMLSFDITYSRITPLDLSKSSNKKIYEKDLAVVEEFLDNFEYRRELSIVVREMLRNDAYFGCVRQTETGKWLLQELSPDFCEITGRWEGGFVFDFNMEWFLQPGVDIDLYPDFFKKKYKEIWGTGKRSGSTYKTYNPSLPPELRGNSQWANWVSVPVDLGVCFKLSPEIATRLPYFAPLFNDLVLQGLMRNLQKNASMAAASKMIIGEVPLLNKETKATVKDSIAVSPELLGKFMALMRSAISEAIKVASAPLQEIEAISFDAENEIYDSYLRTALATSGANTNLIFSSSIKPNAIETQLSLNVDEQMMTAVYDDFNIFMSYMVNRLTSKCDFSLVFEGTDFSINREARLGTAMQLFNVGIVLPQKIAAAIGMKPAELRRHMEEAQLNDFMSMLTPPSIEQAKQMNVVNPVLPPAGDNPSLDEEGKPKVGGRPRKSTTEISDEGVQTRTEGTNIGRGGKI